MCLLALLGFLYILFFIDSPPGPLYDIAKKLKTHSF